MRTLIAAAMMLGFACGACAAGQQCLASWYGTESGHRTANGERFRPEGMTAAHRSIAFGAMVGVRRGSKKITVRINDRGPAAWTGRCIDLAHGAARALGIDRVGTALVTIERTR